MPSLLSLALATGLLAKSALSQTAVTAQGGNNNWLSPVYNYIFQFPLPIPPVAVPETSFTNATTGKTIDFYEINILPFQAQTYPNLGKTSYVGYNGIAPGPTFKMTRGREAVVRFINKYDRPSSIHLHGSYSRSAFDGWAEDVTNPGQFKDYYYPNGQPERTLWYHDHAVSITAVNAYFGQAGFYELKDPAVNLGLPQDQYDVPLMIAARQFAADGSLVSPANERVSLYGDVITVNAQPWPYMKVEPRKYKFRLLDASVSRTFRLYLVDDSAPTTRLPFTVVAADAGYLSKPVPTTDVVIAMAERWEIVIDFAQYAGKNLTIMNERQFQTNPDFAATDRVIRFVVGNTVTSTANNGPIPSVLGNLAIPPPKNTIDHEFEFQSKNGQWLINGVGFEDVANRILAKPQRGKVERWRLINKGGGWSHPIHVHLVDFQVESRVGGRGAVTPYEAASLKDVVYLGTNEQVEILADFAPWPGVYMFHCHNLVHEDHDMMAAFNVSNVDLSAYGYDDKVNLVDPMFDLFRAKAFTATDLAQVKAVTLPFFQNLNAYPNAQLVNAALSSFYQTALPTATNFKRAPLQTTFATVTTESEKPEKTETEKPEKTEAPEKGEEHHRGRHGKKHDGKDN